MAVTAHLVGYAAVAGLGAAGVNLMLSSGRAAFQMVFHVGTDEKRARRLSS